MVVQIIRTFMKPKHNNLKSSLFVGRWQPFHKGHKTLIESVLKKGKPVVIAIRDTEIDHKNPYSVYERWTKIQEILKDYGSLVKIVTIPDIDEICYGRDVGYDIRRIDLDSKLEKISGTAIREKNPPNLPVIWLTGQSGSGKTTLANILSKRIDAVVLDGNEMRESISLGNKFSKKDREEHNLRVARLAKVLSKRSPVIVSVIAPFTSTRKKIDLIVAPFWIFIKKDLPLRKNYPYQEPITPNYIVNSDTQSTDTQVRLIIQKLENEGIVKK